MTNKPDIKKSLLTLSQKRLEYIRNWPTSLMPVRNCDAKDLLSVPTRIGEHLYTAEEIMHNIDYIDTLLSLYNTNQSRSLIDMN